MNENPIIPVVEDPAERRVGISHNAYLALFLDKQDFGGRLRQVQDSRLKGPDLHDRAFPKYQGILAGFAVWMGQQDQPLWRVVDARIMFPTVWQASAYHAARLRHNSEGAPLVPDAPPVGQECRVFGGTRKMLGIEVTAFMYIFRVQRTVVKLFAAQGQEAVKDPLTVGHVRPLVQRIVNRIQASSE